MIWYEQPILWWLRLSACHFVLGFFVGLSVFWLTSTILFHLRSDGRLELPDSCIHIFSLLPALSLSVVAHVLEDYCIGKF